MTQTWMGLGFGFLLGATFAWLLRAVKIAELRERILHAEKLLALEQATKEKLQNEFKLAAAEALQGTAEQFLNSAIKDLRQVKTEADESIQKKSHEISSSFSDIKSKLEDYQKIVKKFEEERFSMYAKLDQSLSQVLGAEQSIRIETAALKRVLTASSGVRGKWGERVLQEILEQNNLVRGIHFDMQVHLQGDESDVRPDFIIHLPGGKRLVIDSKEVAAEYVLAQETDDFTKQKEHYERLVMNIRNNFIKLGRKEYQAQLDADIPFVVMFIPSEAAIRAAFDTDPGIFEEATQKRVILASPMTIIPLVYLIAHGWQQQELATNAQELGSAVEELGNRLHKFVGHLFDIRTGIKKAAEGWDRAIGSWQTRVSPQIEQTKKLGGRLKDAEPLTAMDTQMRELTADTE